MKSNKIKVIGICGFKRSGKSTLSSYFVNKYDAKEIAVATPLKEICQILFGFSSEDMNDANKDKINKKYGFAPRKAMQRIGTELFRDRLNDAFPEYTQNSRKIWSSILERTIDKNTGLIVIPDVRFPEECEVINKYKHHAYIKITRPNVMYFPEHESEAQNLSKFINDNCVEIANIGNLDEYIGKFESVGECVINMLYN